MKRIIGILFVSALLGTVTCSCRKDCGMNPGTEQKKMILTVECAGAVKSSFSDENVKIGSFCVFAYRDGLLAAAGRSSGNGVELVLDAGERYALFAAVNCGDISPAASIDGLDSLRVRFSDYSTIRDGYFPMSGSVPEFTMPTTVGSRLAIPVSRIISKYRLRVVKDLHYCDFDIRSASLCQAALDFTPFAPMSSARSVCTGDCASEEDIEALKSGEYVDFYTIENCQGCIEGNTDPWKKVPESIPGREALCTYLEIGGRWTTPGACSEINYRMYLGRDNCSDLNVERSVENSITLTLTDMGSVSASWKVDRFDEVENRSLKFPSSEVDIIIGSGDNLFPINSDPDGVAYYVKPRSENGDGGLEVDMKGGELNLKSDDPNAGESEFVLELYTWDGVLCDTMKVHMVQLFRNQGYIGSFINSQLVDGSFDSIGLELELGAVDPTECRWTVSDASPSEGFPTRSGALEYDGKALRFKAPADVGDGEYPEGLFPACGAFRIHGEYDEPGSGRIVSGDYFLDIVLDIEISLRIKLYRKLIYCFVPNTPFASEENASLWKKYFPSGIHVCYEDENYIPPFHNAVQYPELKVPASNGDYSMSSYSEEIDKRQLMNDLMPYGFYADSKRVRELLLDREYASNSTEYGTEDWIEGRNGYFRFKLWF